MKYYIYDNTHKCVIFYNHYYNNLDKYHDKLSLRETKKLCKVDSALQIFFPLKIWRAYLKIHLYNSRIASKNVTIKVDKTWRREKSKK